MTMESEFLRIAVEHGITTDKYKNSGGFKYEYTLFQHRVFKAAWEAAQQELRKDMEGDNLRIEHTRKKNEDNLIERE